MIMFDIWQANQAVRMATAMTGQTIKKTDTVEIIEMQTEDLYNQTRWTWEGVRSRFL